MKRAISGAAAMMIGGATVETANLFWYHHWLYGLIVAGAVAASVKVAGRRII